MADNAQKTWFATALPATIGDQITQALHSHGNALPCEVAAVSGQLVTVNFLVTGAQTLPQITMPIDTSVYDWMPIQVGDKGRAVGGTIYIGGVSGQGGGVASLTPRGNLSCLVFQPLANAAWTPPGDQNQRVVQGPAGALVQTMDGTSSINVTEDAVIVTCQGKTWTFNGSGFTMSNSVTAETHEHGGVQSGGSKTTGPVSP